MHAVLLHGQSLTIERPSRAVGTAFGVLATLVALAVALALLLRAIGWPVSFPGFLAYAGAGAMAAIGLLFAFWTYSCATLRYIVSADAVTVRWGPVAHRIPLQTIVSVLKGPPGARVSVRGIGWPGYHVGHGKAGTFANVLFFSTHRSPEEIVYIETPGLSYALSPQDPARFAETVERMAQAIEEPEEIPNPEVHRDALAAHPIWSDRIAQYLALAAILGNVALWGFIFATYPDLSPEITIEFPPLGNITTLESRSEILNIPLTATAMLAANMFVALLFQPRERAATYLVLSGTVFFQVVFWVGAVVAVSNA